MNDDTREKRRGGRLPRIALLACLALVVASLGVALRPGRPQEPAELPFSEQARSAALTETLRLRAAAEQLGDVPAVGGQPAVARTVRLLTNHARALLVPGRDEPALAQAPGPDPASVGVAPSTGALPGSSAASGSAVQTAAPLPASPAALATELAASASQRLADAAVADGGMARLLAAVGTAQLLEASTLASAAGAPAPAAPDAAAPPVSGACPTPSASPSAVAADRPGAADTPPGSPAASAPASLAASAPASRAASPAASAPASLPGALAATVEAELQAVYGYQLALTRLGNAAGPASEQLARHEALAAGAEGLIRMHCAEVPVREAGYAVKREFLAAPAAGLGALEASTLPVYGDVVALSEGETRQWAISGLVGAARRTALWGADAGTLPGLATDQTQFPELPEASPRP